MNILDQIFGEKENSAATATRPNVPADGKAHVFNLIIVDESGSMCTLRNATLSGINETIGTIREAQKQFCDKQSHFLTLVKFGTHLPNNLVTVIDCQPIAEVKDYTDYEPNGCTPLLDAIGVSVNRLHNFVKKDENASVQVTILTDGLENASREYTVRQIKSLIEQMKEEGWTFSYMGSCHDVSEVADNLAIDNVMAFAHTGTGARSTWARERSAKMRSFQELNADWENLSRSTMAEKIIYHKQKSIHYYSNRVTPGNYATPKEGEVMVRFGQSTNEPNILTIDPSSFYSIQEGVKTLVNEAMSHPELHYMMTAPSDASGIPVQNIAKLFTPCIGYENISLPLSFWKILGLDFISGI